MKQHIKLFEDLTSHASYELKRAGLFDKDSDYEGMLGNAVMDLVKVFAKQGHSGFSAPYVISLFTKVANYDTLTDITSDPEEWEDVAKYFDGKPMWQNKRCFRFFSKDGGKTWHDVDKETVHAVQEAVTIIGHDKLVKLFEEYLPGGKEKQVWFKMQETKWKYFYDMVYKHMPKDDQFAKDVLETIKRKKYWCSQRQYDYLKRAVGGENNPGTYGTKN